MTQILDGKQVAAALNEKTREDVDRLLKTNIMPTLAIVRIGARMEDISYERGVIKRCDSTGVQVKQYILPEDTAQETLLETIHTINADTGIHGCLLFRPLPQHMDSHFVCNAVSAEKDVDGITDISLAGVFAGRSHGFPPCTAKACIEILDHFEVNPAGKRVVIVGRSLVVGKPVAMMLVQRDATVTLCHSKTAGLPALCREADILIMAVGKAGFADSAYLHARQTVIDVGINSNEEGKLCGDVAYDQAMSTVRAITPVPGGVGVVTSSVLARHVVEAAIMREKTLKNENSI